MIPQPGERRNHRFGEDRRMVRVVDVVTDEAVPEGRPPVQLVVYTLVQPRPSAPGWSVHPVADFVFQYPEVVPCAG